MSDYLVVYERGADGTISAYTLNHPIAVSARSRDRAKSKILEAIQIYREEMELSGFAIPAPSVEYETATV